MSLTKDKYFELLNSCDDYSVFRCQLSQYVPTKLYKYFSFPDNDDEIRERLHQLVNKQLWFSKRDYLNDPFEFEHISLQTANIDAQQYYRDKQRELEVCCFTALPHNKLMWAHYAAGYKGYCVEFNVNNPDLIYPVIYDDTIPDNLGQMYQKFYDLRSEMCSNPSVVLCNYENRKVILQINYPLFSKDVCWKYEGEYRILASSLEPNGELRSIAEYGLEITKIVVGACCTCDNCQKLKETARTLNIPITKISWDNELALIEETLP